MSNSDIIANLHKSITIRAMQTTAVLYAHPIADTNLIYITSQHSPIPYGTVLANNHIADDGCRLCHECTFTNLWFKI